MRPERRLRRRKQKRRRQRRVEWPWLELLLGRRFHRSVVLDPYRGDDRTREAVEACTKSIGDKLRTAGWSSLARIFPAPSSCCALRDFGWMSFIRLTIPRRRF